MTQSDNPITGSPDHQITKFRSLPRMTDYVPISWLRNGHVMTILTWGRPRRFPNLPRPEPRYFDVAPDARVLAHCFWHGSPWEHPTIVGLHGLEGSSEAHYM